MPTGFDDPCDTADVIVVPVGNDDQPDGRIGIDTNLFQVTKRRGPARSIYARIDDDPLAVPKMQEGTFPVAGSQERKLELVRSRRRYVQRIVSACSWATLLAVDSSASVHTGRRRNRRIDVRLRCPPSLVA